MANLLALVKSQMDMDSLWEVFVWIPPGQASIAIKSALSGCDFQEVLDSLTGPSDGHTLGPALLLQCAWFRLTGLPGFLPWSSSTPRLYQLSSSGIAASERS